MKPKLCHCGSNFSNILKKKEQLYIIWIIFLWCRVGHWFNQRAICGVAWIISVLLICYLYSILSFCSLCIRFCIKG